MSAAIGRFYSISTSLGDNFFLKSATVFLEKWRPLLVMPALIDKRG